MTLKQFDDYLKDLPISQSSKKIYRSLVKALLNDHPEPTIEQLNHFISIKNIHRQNNTRYAIKKYLECIGKLEDYPKLHKTKKHEPIKEKHFLTTEQINQIINHIKNPLFKIIAIIQYNTGSRASEIITINKARISKQIINNIEVIRINVKGKGDIPRYIYLVAEFWKYLESFYNNCRNYPFLDTKDKPIPYLDFWDKVQVRYQRYYEALKEAAKSCGYNIATHDLRRSFGDDIRKKRGMFEAQQALGHKDINTTIKYFQSTNVDIATSMLSKQQEFLQANKEY